MILSFGGKSPRDEGAAFVADNATVQGDVLLKPGTTVWYGAVLPLSVSDLAGAELSYKC